MRRTSRSTSGERKTRHHQLDRPATKAPVLNTIGDDRSIATHVPCPVNEVVQPLPGTRVTDDHDEMHGGVASPAGGHPRCKRPCCSHSDEQIGDHASLRFLLISVRYNSPQASAHRPLLHHRASCRTGPHDPRNGRAPTRHDASLAHQRSIVSAASILRCTVTLVVRSSVRSKRSPTLSVPRRSLACSMGWSLL